MDKYINSYIGRRGKHHKYIIPEISIISNTTPRENLVDHEKNNPNINSMDAYRAVSKVNPYTFRISHPIALESFVIGSSDMFYEVWEGIYCVNDGTLKLKVKKQYGK